MNSYAPIRFRTAFALGAVALTVATLSLAVLVPAAVSPTRTEVTTLAARGASPAAIEVTIIPAHIDVVGMRDDGITVTRNRETTQRTSFRG